MIKRTFYILLLVLLYNVSFSQSVFDLLYLADKNFDDRNFPYAAFYYEATMKAILDSNFQDTDVYPYDPTDYRPIIKEEKEETIDTTKSTSDTTNIIDPKLLSSTENPYYQHSISRLAECHRRNFKYKAAEETFTKAFEIINLKEFPLTQYNYGLLLMHFEKYDEAIEIFEKFKAGIRVFPNPHLNLANKGIKGCEFAKESIKNAPISTKTELAPDVFNPGQSNYAANFKDNEQIVIFSSAPKDSIVDEINSDLFIVKKSGDTWSSSENIGANINTDKHEGASSFGKDLSSIFLTRINDQGISEIYISVLSGSNWLKPRKLNGNINTSGFSSKHPSYSWANKALYFSSNREGGLGGYDLYYCEIDEHGNAKEALNLGEIINTPEDELTPNYIDEHQSLYFSSNGHIGMGGSDIFVSAGSLSDLSVPQNLGFPINSSKEDLYYCMNWKDETGFITSNRISECAGCEQGDCYMIFEFSKGFQILVSGQTFDEDTKDLLPKTIVRYIPILTGADSLLLKEKYGDNKVEYPEAMEVIVGRNADYSFKLASDIDYRIEAEQKGYFKYVDTLSTRYIEQSTNIKKDLFLKPIPEGEIVLEGILYDLDKWDLRPISMRILEGLVDILEDNPTFVIEIAAHTDVRGSDKYNQTLSQKRAQSVVDFLIEMGTDHERLHAKGYGESQLKVKNAETEEEHQVNRRTTFRILSTDYGLK